MALGFAATIPLRVYFALAISGEMPWATMILSSISATTGILLSPAMKRREVRSPILRKRAAPTWLIPRSAIALAYCAGVILDQCSGLVPRGGASLAILTAPSSE